MADDDGLLGVSALAKALGVGKSTVSKQTAAGKIPVARLNDKGHPLYDLDAVKTARTDLNPLMRRDDRAPSSPEPPERRSDAADHAPRSVSALQEAATVEKQLKGRDLFGRLVQREQLTVLKSVVDLDQTTIARRTRDAVTAFMVDKASAAYAFAGTPRTEAEWRVWLAERTREAFNNFAAQLALEDDDEFADDDVPDVDRAAGEPDAAPVS